MGYANGNSFGNPNGASLDGFDVVCAPGEGTGAGDRPASASWLLAVRTWRVR